MDEQQIREAIKEALGKVLDETQTLEPEEEENIAYESKFIPEDASLVTERKQLLNKKLMENLTKKKKKNLWG